MTYKYQVITNVDASVLETTLNRYKSWELHSMYHTNTLFIVVFRKLE